MGIGFADVKNVAIPEPLLVPAGDLLPDQRAFISAYLAVGTIRGAVKRSKIHHLYHYTWINDDPNYQAAFARVKEIVLDGDIETIRQRGIEGWDEPLDYKGELTGAVRRKFSDNLAMFWIKSQNPAFKDNHKAGDTINNVTINADKAVFDFGKFRSLLK
jgi:hypothetical protein